MYVPARQPAMAATHEVHCGDLMHFVTTCPPLPVEWGSGWWVRVDDVWVRICERRMGERFTPELERRLCELVEALYRARVSGDDGIA